MANKRFVSDLNLKLNLIINSKGIAEGRIGISSLSEMAKNLHLWLNQDVQATHLLGREIYKMARAQDDFKNRGELGVAIRKFGAPNSHIPAREKGVEQFGATFEAMAKELSLAKLQAKRSTTDEQREANIEKISKITGEIAANADIIFRAISAHAYRAGTAQEQLRVSQFGEVFKDLKAGDLSGVSNDILKKARDDLFKRFEERSTYERIGLEAFKTGDIERGIKLASGASRISPISSEELEAVLKKVDSQIEKNAEAERARVAAEAAEKSRRAEEEKARRAAEAAEKAQRAEEEKARRAAEAAEKAQRAEEEKTRRRAENELKRHQEQIQRVQEAERKRIEKDGQKQLAAQAAREQKEAEARVRVMFQPGAGRFSEMGKSELAARLKQIESAIQFKKQEESVRLRLGGENARRELVEVDKISAARMKALKTEGLTLTQLQAQASEIKGILKTMGETTKLARVNKLLKSISDKFVYLHKSIRGAILDLTALPRMFLRLGRAVRDIWNMGSNFYQSIMNGYRTVVSAIWKTSQYGERVGRYAQAYGISPEVYQAWEHVLRRSGQSEEEFGQGLKSLVKHLGPARRAAKKEIETGKTSNDANLDYFHQWGFSSRDILKFTKPEDLYLQMLTRAGNMRTSEGDLDYANISMLASKILGGGSEGFTNMALLYAGKQGELDLALNRAQALGASSEGEIKSMRGLKASFEDLSFAAQSAVRKMTVPAIQEVAKGFDFFSSQFETDKIDQLLREIGADFAKEVKDIIDTLKVEMGVDNIAELLAKTYEAIKPLIPGGKELVSFGAKMISLIAQIAGSLAKMVDFLPAFAEFTDIVAGYLYKDDAIKDYLKGEGGRNIYSSEEERIVVDALRKAGAGKAKEGAIDFNKALKVAPGMGGVTADQLSKAYDEIMDPTFDATKRRILEEWMTDKLFEVKQIHKQDEKQISSIAKQMADSGFSDFEQDRALIYSGELESSVENASKLKDELERELRAQVRERTYQERGSEGRNVGVPEKTFTYTPPIANAWRRGVDRWTVPVQRTILETEKAIDSIPDLTKIIWEVTKSVTGQRAQKVENKNDVEVVINVTTEEKGLFASEAKIREVADRVYGVVKDKLRRAEQNKSPAYSRGLPNNEGAWR